MQVNAVTRSGTNQLSGLFRGNFRDSRFNAEDPIQMRVIPTSNQQLSTAVGGPIVLDRFHFFGNFEYERSPKTSIWTTPFPAFNVTLTGKETVKMGGGRLDYQLSSSMRLMAKGDLWRNWNAGFTGGSAYPSSASTTRETGNNLNIQLLNVLSNRAVNEVKTGYAGYYYFNTCHTNWDNHWYRDDGPYGPVRECGPVVQFTGFTMGGNQGYPRHRGQDRDDRHGEAEHAAEGPCAPRLPGGVGREGGVGDREHRDDQHRRGPGVGHPAREL